MDEVYDECAYQEVQRKQQYDNLTPPDVVNAISSSRNTKFQNMAAQCPGFTSHLFAIRIIPRVL